MSPPGSMLGGSDTRRLNPLRVSCMRSLKQCWLLGTSMHEVSEWCAQLEAALGVKDGRVMSLDGRRAAGQPDELQLPNTRAEAALRAQLDAVLIAEDGGIVSLAIDGYQHPLAILVGQAEALALLHSAGSDLRRPSTLATWRHCLLVRSLRALKLEPCLAPLPAGALLHTQRLRVHRNPVMGVTVASVPNPCYACTTHTPHCSGRWCASGYPPSAALFRIPLSTWCHGVLMRIAMWPALLHFPHSNVTACWTKTGRTLLHFLGLSSFPENVHSVLTLSILRDAKGGLGPSLEGTRTFLP